MKKFKVEVSKNQKKYTLVFHAENEILARERVHNEGYSILNVSEIGEESIGGNKFIFEAIKDGDIKSGKVVGDDIFKVYLKLVDSFGYKLNFLYPESENTINEEEKLKILKQLEEQYIIYGRNKENKLNKVREDLKQEKEKKKKLEHFYLKKELDETYKLIKFILEKIQGIIEGSEKIDISPDQKEKLKTIYNNIIKLKKSTNLSKLKEIGELALIKIGSLELSHLEKNKEEETRELLTDTNKLLKKIGSNKHFIEKDKDIKHIVGNIFSKAGGYFNTKKENKKENKTIEKGTFSYLKTELLLKKYKDRLKDNNINIIKNILVFIIPFGLKNAETKENLMIKRAVIKQNIFLLKKKISGKSFSYTKIKKGIKEFFENFNKVLFYLRRFIFKIAFLYGIIFILYINFSYYFDNLNLINYKGILFFLTTLLVYLFTLLSRGVITFILNFVFLFFIIIFGVVNF